MARIQNDKAVEVKKKDNQINTDRRDFVKGAAAATAALLGAVGVSRAGAATLPRDPTGTAPLLNAAATPGTKFLAQAQQRQPSGPPDLQPPPGMGPHGVPDLRFAMSYKEPVVESSRVMMQYLKALTQRDLRGMAAMCHFPLGSYEGTTPTLVNSLDDMMAKPLPSMNTNENPERWTDHDGYITPGTYDCFQNLEILNSDAYAVNLAMTYYRYTKDGKLTMTCDGVYTVTNNDGKWGIQLMSTIFKPANLSQALFPAAEQAALFTRIQHDLGPNTNDSEADIGDRTPGLTFSVDNPSAFFGAQMGAGRGDYGAMSPFRTKGVMSRLRHSVTTADVAGQANGDAMLNVRQSGGNPQNPDDVAKYKDDWKWYRDMYERTGLGKWGWTYGYLPYSRVVHQFVDKAHVFSGLTRYLISGEIHDMSAELSIVTWKKGHWGKAGNGAYICMHDRANDAKFILS